MPRRNARPWGVNLVGYLAGELGLGESARLMDAALTAAKVPTSTIAVSRNLASRATAEYRRSDDSRYATTLVCVNSDQTREALDQVDRIEGTRKVAYWYWETQWFPPRHPAFLEVDEVWVATEFVRSAIAPRSPVPVVTVPPPLPQASGVPGPVPARLGLPTERPWFLFAFDYLSTVERKNPLGLIEAFTRAFPPAERQEGRPTPLLVIKTINAIARPAESARVRQAADDAGDVVVIDEYLDAAERDALMAGCTAYVSLHRAEGLGLTIAEAMSWGRPVIATAYSGPVDFLTDRNALLVPWTLTAIPPGSEPYRAGTPWAEPDLEVAAAAMRTVVDEPERAAALGAQAASDIATLHSPEAAAARVREALVATSSPRATAERVRVFGRVSWLRASLVARRLARRVVRRGGGRLRSRL